MLTPPIPAAGVDDVEADPCSSYSNSEGNVTGTAPCMSAADGMTINGSPFRVRSCQSVQRPETANWQALWNREKKWKPGCLRERGRGDGEGVLCVTSLTLLGPVRDWWVKVMIV